MIFAQESRTSSDNLNDCLGLREPNKHTECFFFNVDFHLGISTLTCAKLLFIICKAPLSNFGIWYLCSELVLSILPGLCELTEGRSKAVGEI